MPNVFNEKTIEFKKDNLLFLSSHGREVLRITRCYRLRRLRAPSPKPASLSCVDPSFLNNCTS